MIIEKSVKNKGNCLRKERYYQSAREAMYDLLRNMRKQDMLDTILLPAYIGWSPREGSGIYDPVASLKELSVRFYQMTTDLQINQEDLLDKIRDLPAHRFAVLLVNYFGFPDEGKQVITKLIRAAGGWLIEDNAHGYFTYHFSEENDCDASFFSLHKLFPFPKGGSLIINHPELEKLSFQDMGYAAFDPYPYNLPAIARIRRSNYQRLEELLYGLCDQGHISLLYKKGVEAPVVPQSLPVRILTCDRNQLYEKMNEAGYGVVSLYHTLIEPLRTPEFKDSVSLSGNILNLPVHQDVNPDFYPDMIGKLQEYCGGRET